MNDAESLDLIRNALGWAYEKEAVFSAYAHIRDRLASLETSRLPTSGAGEPTPMIREPLSRASFAAAAKFYGVESAEGLAFRIGADPETEWSVAATAKYIEADRAAVDQRARVAVLREIREAEAARPDTDYTPLYQAMDKIEAKYAAKEPA